MAPDGYSPPLYITDTFGQPIYYAYTNCDTNTSSWTWDDGEAAKEARKAWLRFTRGTGWLDVCRVAWQAGVRLRLQSWIVPGLRVARRQPRRIRWFTLKQLRRFGVI